MHCKRGRGTSGRQLVASMVSSNRLRLPGQAAQKQRQQQQQQHAARLAHSLCSASLTLHPCNGARAPARPHLSPRSSTMAPSPAMKRKARPSMRTLRQSWLQNVGSACGVGRRATHSADAAALQTARTAAHVRLASMSELVYSAAIGCTHCLAEQAAADARPPLGRRNAPASCKWGSLRTPAPRLSPRRPLPLQRCWPGQQRRQVARRSWAPRLRAPQQAPRALPQWVRQRPCRTAPRGTASA